VHQLIAKSHQGQLTALAVAAVLSFSAAPAAALSLGRVTVQSALGEPLRAEIDLLDINAEEAASLQARVAQPDAFKAAGLDYNAALGNLRATLLRRPDGRAYLSLSSDRVVNDPFVDMILETSWSSGRIVRDYTMLFDPPHLRNTATPVPITAQVPAPAPAQTPNLPPATSQAQAITRVAPVAAPRPVTAAPKAVTLAAPKPAPQLDNSSGQTVTVKPGDTAGRIAATNKPANVSLDQMLVALLRNNPDAFIQDNVNRIKAGAILTLPSAQQTTEVAPEQATQIIVAQSQDFNDFRQKFASNVTTTKTAPASREVSGKVDATVKDKKPMAATPDKLTLSKGVVAGTSNEEKLAQARNQQEAAARAAELAKNISDLSQLAAAASKPVAQNTASAPAVTATPPAAPVAKESASKSMPAAAVPVKPVSAAATAKEPAPEPGFIDSLLENPLLPAGAAALLALLAALGIYKVRQRKQASAFGADLPESGLSEPFSGASGGQNVDTSDSLTTGSSMVYTPSQLDAVDDVDPVAEADVYLAYGRDLQAEEILKDALRSDPQRLAIHLKLLEIYAKRPDAKAFESVATLAFNLTDGTGPQWEQVCEKGISIDPDNALYLPGGQPLGGQQADKPATAAASVTPADQATAAFSAESTQVFISPMTAPTELDLDLDFSAEELSSAATAASQDMPAPSLPELPALAPVPIEVALPVDSEPAELAPDAVSFDATAAMSAVNIDEGFNFTAPLPLIEPLTMAQETPATLTLATQAPAAPIATPPPGNDLMDFDLGSLSLDLNDDLTGNVADFGNEPMDPLETKLALADEFRAIGDDEGARALIEEVLAEATGDLKIKAQNALNKL